MTLLPTLADMTDVAVELGLPDEVVMTESQRARAAALLERVSYLFRTECGRPFTPGQYETRCRVEYGSGGTQSIRLAEKPSEIISITDDYGYELDVRQWQISGYELRRDRSAPRRFSERLYTTAVTVCYNTLSPVPVGVRQTVASIVARYIRLSDTVGPSAGAATEMGAGAYRARFAEWTTRSVHLTDEDRKTARAYRDPRPTQIVVGT